jgi:hypothetical protein
MSEFETEGMVKGPDGTILRFFYDTERNEAATAAEGRPIFDNVLFVDVITPGQKASTPRFEIERIWAEQSLKALNLTDLSRKSFRYAAFREQIEKFKLDEKASDMAGTPLKQWPRIDRGLAASLAAVNVYTVEQLAGVSDQNLSYIGMGGRELREAARAFLQASDTAQAERLAGTVETLRQENEMVKASLKEAHELMATLKDQMVRMAQRSIEPTTEHVDSAPAPIETTVQKGGKLKPLV